MLSVNKLHPMKASAESISRHDGDEEVHDIVYTDGVDTKQPLKKIVI